MRSKPLTTIVTIAYVIFVFIIMFLLFHSKQDSGYNIVFSAEQIRSLIAEGDSLRGSNQDSCIAVYNRAIEMAQSVEQNETTKHLAGLGYAGLAALMWNIKYRQFINTMPK